MSRNGTPGGSMPRNGTAPNGAAPNGAGLKPVALQVRGMTCASCVRRAEQALLAIEGVHGAHVNLSNERAVALVEPGVSYQQLIEAIEGQGYEAELAGQQQVSFAVQGMTCASCVRRVEQALAAVPGVLDANVNLATERAVATFVGGPEVVAALRRAIEQAGYQVVEGSTDRETAEDRERAARAREMRRLVRDVTSAAVLTALVLIGSLPHMLPGWSAWVPPILTNNYTLMLLSGYVLFVSGSRFFQGSYAVLRHRSADMNVLVAMGTTAAWLYSAAMTLFPEALVRLGFPYQIYFDTSAVVVTLILVGRLLEARAKGKTTW